MDVVCEEYNKSDASSNVYSFDSQRNENSFSVITKKENTPFKSLRNIFATVFLPEGYPESVSDDYLQYQVWDSLQAFSSSVTNTLATHAVLTGIGVGDSSATPIAATITWLIRDGTAMLGRIVFAYIQGSQFDADSKKWRLFADVLNDISIAVDIITPVFKQWTLALQCLSSLGRSLVGTAGGATRAALTQHQARRNNLADVSAKDGSQETVVNLCALVFSLTVVPLILTSQSLVWTTFVSLTLFHIYANYKAVKAVSMEVVNRYRFEILVDNYLINGHILSVKEVNSKENVIPFLKFGTNACKAKIGLPLRDHIVSYKQYLAIEEANRNRYLLSIDWNKSPAINISLYENENNTIILEALFHAQILQFCKKKIQSSIAELCILQQKIDSLNEHEAILETRIFTETTFSSFISKASEEGWDFSRILIPIGDWRIKSHHL